MKDMSALCPRVLHHQLRVIVVDFSSKQLKMNET